MTSSQIYWFLIILPGYTPFSGKPKYHIKVDISYDYSINIPYDISMNIPCIAKQHHPVDFVIDLPSWNMNLIYGINNLGKSSYFTNLK